MSKRYYCSQYCDARAGWTDIPGSAFLAQKKSETVASSFAKSHMVATRTIRKPYGWEPSEHAFVIPCGDHEIGTQAREARKQKSS